MNRQKNLSKQLRWKLALTIMTATGLSLTGISSALNNAALAAPVAPAVAFQDKAYQQDKVPDRFDLASLDPKRDRAQYSTRRTDRSEFQKKITDSLASGSMSAAQQAEAKNWLDQVVLAEMTLNNPDVLVQLGDMRNDLFRSYIVAASPNNRRFLIEDVIVPRAQQIASQDYHPAARVNAVQILNWLDIREGVSGSQLPQPSRRALEQLLNLVNDANTPEYLVATAMAGIQRQAELDGQVPTADKMPTAVSDMIADAALAQLTKYAGKQTDTEPGYLISRRAVQILDGLNLPENHSKMQQVQSALQKVADDNNAGPWLRMDAMMALAETPLADPTAYVKKLGQLVTLVAKLERKSMVAAKNQMTLESQISDKTVTASSKKKSQSAKDRMNDLGMGAGTGSMALGQGDGGMGGGGFGGFGALGDGGLLPYHLFYLRTNVKLATNAAQHILGTQDKATTGLRFNQAVQSNAELRQLINDIDAQLVKLQEATDIGLVEEKELTRNERLRMPREEQELLDQPTTVRVLGKMGFCIRDLETLVGKIELAGEKEDEMAVNASKSETAELTEPEAGDNAETEGDTEDDGSGAAGSTDDNSGN